jgi:hypothetical protein
MFNKIMHDLMRRNRRYAKFIITRFSVQAAYVPGGNGNGNVLFAWTKWTFD